MTSKLKVNLINDSGDNNIITSDGSGNVTLNSTLGNFTSTGIDDNADATAITIDSSENVGIGTTSPSKLLHVSGGGTTPTLNTDDIIVAQNNASTSDDCKINIVSGTSGGSRVTFGDADDADIGKIIYNNSNNAMIFHVNNSECMRFDSDGTLLVNKNASNQGTVGLQVGGTGANVITQANGDAFRINRTSSDGNVVLIMQDTSTEGTISVSGSTVSYNGFTGTHWSRLADNSKPTILKGTILESLDEMCDWYQVQFDITDNEGNTTTQKESYALGDGESVGDVITYTYEGTDYQATIIQEGDVKHTKSKVSDTVDAKNVYGVFVAWDNDDDTVNDMYVAQTGTFVVRLNSSVTSLNKGDLIQSNGDGTGKVQSDDIIRASTVAKVLSTTKIETYSDGSYIVPCSLHC